MIACFWTGWCKMKAIHFISEFKFISKLIAMLNRLIIWKCDRKFQYFFSARWLLAKVKFKKIEEIANKWWTWYVQLWVVMLNGFLFGLNLKKIYEKLVNVGKWKGYSDLLGYFYEYWRTGFVFKKSEQRLFITGAHKLN